MTRYLYYKIYILIAKIPKALNMDYDTFVL